MFIELRGKPSSISVSHIPTYLTAVVNGKPIPEEPVPPLPIWQKRLKILCWLAGQSENTRRQFLNIWKLYEQTSVNSNAVIYGGVNNNKLRKQVEEWNKP